MTKLEFVIDNTPGLTFLVPLSVLLWMYIAAYIIHLLEEIASSYSYISMVQTTFTKWYSGYFYALFNVAVLGGWIAAVVKYESDPSSSALLLPLCFAAFFVVNAAWHILLTLFTRRYNPGTISGLLFGIITYVLIRYYYIVRAAKAQQTEKLAAQKVMVKAATYGAIAQGVVILLLLALVLVQRIYECGTKRKTRSKKEKLSSDESSSSSEEDDGQPILTKRHNKKVTSTTLPVTKKKQH